jgi:hypothetical protein
VNRLFGTLIEAKILAQAMEGLEGTSHVASTQPGIDKANKRGLAGSLNLNGENFKFDLKLEFNLVQAVFTY